MLSSAFFFWGAGGRVSFGGAEGVQIFFAEHASLQSTLLCRARFFAEHTSLQSTLLCKAHFFAEHASLQSTLLCKAHFFADYTSSQSTLLCRALFFAEHASLQSTLLCRAHFFAEHTSSQSTLLCRALFFAEHASLQSTLLCRARFFAEHTSLQSTLPLLCRAHFLKTVLHQKGIPPHPEERLKTFFARSGAYLGSVNSDGARRKLFLRQKGSDQDQAIPPECDQTVFAPKRVPGRTEA